MLKLGRYPPKKIQWSYLNVTTVRACLHGDGVPQIGEVTRLSV